jgi:predicted O-methyltransferase YrrM
VNLAESFSTRCELTDYINFWNEDASNIAKRIIQPESVDLVFIDADKDRYELYLEICSKILKKSGYIIVDNAVDSGAIMINFINKLMDFSKWSTFIFDMDNGILVAQKKY